MDWQVTVSFYAALHFVNAHLAKFELQYRSHTDVKHAINPLNNFAVGKLPEPEYQAYISLLSLSRLARYLFNDQNPETAFTYGKHLAKALRHLNTLMCYFCEKYGIEQVELQIDCAEIRSDELRFFTKKRPD